MATLFVCVGMKLKGFSQRSNIQQVIRVTICVLGLKHGLVNLFVWMIMGVKLTDATCGFRAFRLELIRKANFDWHAEWLHTYGLEYYLDAKAVMEPRIRFVEVPVTMRYPAEGSYSKIRPGVDWLAMLRPWFAARFDGKGFDL